MGRTSFLSPLLLGALFVCDPAGADSSETAVLRNTPALLRMSYEVLDIGPDETMGLGGVHYLVNVNPDWYAGVSAFGALQGERGGFFAGGFTVGTGKRFASKWTIDASLFVGGGGGGAAPQGGGLMLRPNLGISRDVGGVMLGGGVSYVTFPNGGINSTQLNLTLGIPFEVYYGRARDTGKSVDAGDLNGLQVQESEWLATVGEYSPADNTTSTAGAAMTASFKLLGFEYRQYLDAHRYFFVETAGAIDGQADGYAQLLGGAGYRTSLLSQHLHLSASLAAGGAGGGQVDTGGGLVAKARVGLDYDFASALKLGLEGGWIGSGGSFSAHYYGLNLGYRLGEIGAGTSGQAWQGDAEARLSKWRLAGMQQTTLGAARKNGSDQDLSLIGVKVEKFLTDAVYLTGQAQGAYSGGAGGYAVGLLGVGWEIPLREDGRLSFNVEFAAGAAGGGGVDVGGGAIIQPQLGLTWHLNGQYAACLEVGRVKALDGELDSNVVGVGLKLEFSRPEYHRESGKNDAK